MIGFSSVRKMASIAIPIILSCLTVACDDNSPSQAPKAKVEVVASVKDLAKCESGNEGEMAWVEGEHTARICINEEWQAASESSNDTISVNHSTLYTTEYASCSVQELDDKSGIKIICNGDSIGVLLNGTDGTNGTDGVDGKNGVDGKDGADGKDGVDGKDGKSCTMENDSDGIVYVTCDSSTIKLYKAFCDTAHYDPDTHFCQDEKVYPKCENKKYDPSKLLCDTRDNQLYPIVTIGSQTWMARNLNYRYLQKTSTLDSSSFCYNDDEANCAIYGRLYLWSATLDSTDIITKQCKGCSNNYTSLITILNRNKTVRGICPIGWHLPSNKEWSILFDAVGGTNIGCAKLKSTVGWYNNGNGTDDYGFSALPGGDRRTPTFGYIDYQALFWSWSGSSTPYRFACFYNTDKTNLGSLPTSFSQYIRCLKD